MTPAQVDGLGDLVDHLGQFAFVAGLLGALAYSVAAGVARWVWDRFFGSRRFREYRAAVEAAHQLRS
jgi:hypothetical protein